MWEGFSRAVVDLFSISVSWHLLLGTGIGIAIGLLPGIGTTATLAITLPFIFDTDWRDALALALGILAGAGFSGDLTSILFGVPGEASSSALILDGHALTRQGKAHYAAGAAIAASLAGTVVGALALAASVPVIRPLLLTIGVPELLMIGLAGLSLVGMLGGGSPIKGIIAALFGLLLSSVGMDRQVGIYRYTFGLPYLVDGLPLIPLVLGLFAIPELVDLATHGTASASGSGPTGRIRFGSFLEGMRECLRHWRLVLGTSLVGVGIGVIPGLGGGVAQWVAYAYSAQNVRDVSRVGKGAIEGVLGPATVNNSKEGGSLIPTVAFGIPGSASMALLLPILFIVGLRPGPPMLAENVNVTLFMVITLAVAGILACLMSLLVLPVLANITFIKNTRLIPYIMLLVVLGALAERHQSLDLIVTLLAGAIGLLMVNFSWSRSAMLLGFVLGPYIENNFWIATQIYGPRWLLRPGILLAIVLLTLIAWWSYRRLSAMAAPPATAGSANTAARTDSGLAQGHLSDVVLGSITLAAAVAFMMPTLRWPGGASLFPMVVGGAAAVLSLALLISSVKLRHQAASRSQEPTQVRLGTAVDWKSVLSSFGWLVGLLALIEVLGFGVLAIAPFMLAYLLVQGRERWTYALGHMAAVVLLWETVLKGLLNLS